MARVRLRFLLISLAAIAALAGCGEAAPSDGASQQSDNGSQRSQVASAGNNDCHPLDSKALVYIETQIPYKVKVTEGYIAERTDKDVAAGSSHVVAVKIDYHDGDLGLNPNGRILGFVTNADAQHLVPANTNAVWVLDSDPNLQLPPDGDHAWRSVAGRAVRTCISD